MNNNESRNIGYKYQIYENNELKVRRIIKNKGNDTYVLKEKDNKDKNYLITKEELDSKYIKLQPEALIQIMITREPNFDNKVINDIYVCVSRLSDINNDNSIPSLILRQNVYSNIKNITNDNMFKVYVGDCLTIMNSSKEDLLSMLEFTSIEKSFSIAAYIDDTLEDILMCVPNKLNKDISIVLENIKTTLGDTAMGVSSSFKDLLIDNDFIGNYNSIFNITKIDFPIILDTDNFNKDDIIELNSKQKKRLEDVLRRYISNVKVIKYDKDIDISKIVQANHVVVSDSNNDIFIISYDVDGYYDNGGENSDVLKAMTR